MIQAPGSQVLTRVSCEQLMAEVRCRGWRRVLMPQALVAGSLGWSEVWRAIAPVLDSRVQVVCAD